VIGTNRAADLGLRVVAGIVGFGLGAVSAMYEALLADLRWHSYRVPLSPVLALLANPLLVLFAFWGTGRLAAALLPAIPWLAVMVMAATRTTEGDLVFTGDNWVGLATLFVGAIAFAVGILPLMRPASAVRFERRSI
jgi:hypothetical protein